MNLLPEKRDCYEAVLQAVLRDPSSLEEASDRLRSNHDLVLAAVKVEDGEALQYASDELRDSSDIVLAAITTNAGCNFECPLRYASERLRNDKEMVLKAIDSDGIPGDSLKFTSFANQADPMLVMAVLRKWRSSTLRHVTQLQLDGVLKAVSAQLIRLNIRLMSSGDRALEDRFMNMKERRPLDTDEWRSNKMFEFWAVLTVFPAEVSSTMQAYLGTQRAIAEYDEMKAYEDVINELLRMGGAL
jgi:Domain of unknown function (DUF4116)